ncbi:hypothetical protein [Halomonas heilongjiangensis]|uniref:Uncharacterized protein n=1 Tax=Halomonas heilongjiangensis TaxID=1387883 RepID=A0A2N7TU74_9GAMM|nr:hypothetical protein [Halomonas heilongjiangensis]PMR71737.1 hypothetical protein C1H66_01485 [Halomonas heilongjiangensis]PXX89982.1 hypothetical protein CR158_10395 [Halomonas heilongjiangensis]
MKKMIRIDDYMSLRLIMWSFPSLEVISRREAYEHLASKWEYVHLRSLEDHEIELINGLIDEFGPLVPQYRTFQTYSADRPYTSGRPIERVSRPRTPRTAHVADYPQLHKSALRHGVSDQEMTCNEAFLWYTEHWYDIDLDSMGDHEKHFLNELIFEFGPILPSVDPEDEDVVGEPIISV